MSGYADDDDDDVGLLYLLTYYVYLSWHALFAQNSICILDGAVDGFGVSFSDITVLCLMFITKNLHAFWLCNMELFFPFKTTYSIFYFHFSTLNVHPIPFHIPIWENGKVKLETVQLDYSFQFS